MAEIDFTAEDWERIEPDNMAWWAGELERPLVNLAVPNPIRLATPIGANRLRDTPWVYLSNYPLSMPAEAVAERYAASLAATRHYADAFPFLWVNFGPGIAAGFLGADVNTVTEPAETVWFTPTSETPLADMRLAYDPANTWYRRVKDVTAALVGRFGDQVQVGQTDLGGNLDILASLRGTQQLLMDLLEQPDEVARLVHGITALWLRYYAELDAVIRHDSIGRANRSRSCRGTSCWTPLWSTGRTYMLQCDFAYMIGPRMFERYVAPDIAACCDYLDHGFYHLDGRGEIPHLDLLLDIPRLRGIQWIPGDGQPTPDRWLPLLKRIRDGGKLCQVFVSTEGARRIVQNLGGKGFMLVIQPGDGEFSDAERAHAFLKTLAQEDITEPGDLS